MKSFEKWLDKSSYEFTIRNCKEKDERYYYIKGSNGKCIVIIKTNVNKVSKVFDDKGYMSVCKNVKETIELVNFLAGGEC